jgi:hypothetical protein
MRLSINDLTHLIVIVWQIPEKNALQKTLLSKLRGIREDMKEETNELEASEK